MLSIRNRRNGRRLATAAALGCAFSLTTAVLADEQFTSEDPMMDGQNGWSSEALFTVGEAFDGYTPPGVLDGLGAYLVDDQVVRVLANHELNGGSGYTYQLANGTELTGARVSFFDFDRDSRGLCDAGPAYDTIYDRNGDIVTTAEQINESGDPTEGLGRLCSARLVEAGQYNFDSTIFFTGEEDSDGTEWALDVVNGDLWACPELGRGAWENVTPIETGNPRRVALLLGDDTAGAPLYLWIGNKTRGDFLARNGLAKGRLFVWVADNFAADPGSFNGTGSTLEGSFVRVPTRRRALAGQEGYDDQGYLDADTLRDYAVSIGAFRFSRPEDLHEDPFDPTCAVLASTGRGQLFPADNWGTTYKIDTDLANIRRPAATLTILNDGDELDDPDFGIRSPDNVCWAEDGFIYAQEDRSTSPGSLFGGSSGIEASVWALDPTNEATTRIGVIDRSAVPAGQVDGGAGDIGNWESSGIIDVTRLFRTSPGEKLLLLDVQAHGIDLGGDDLVQGGQLVLLSKGADIDD